MTLPMETCGGGASQVIVVQDNHNASFINSTLIFFIGFILGLLTMKTAGWFGARSEPERQVTVCAGNDIKLRTRTVITQTGVTYTALRGCATPRFQPQCTEGAWAEP